MKTLRSRILCSVFSALFFLNIVSGNSFGENILLNWKISTTRLLEETLPGASLLLYPTDSFPIEKTNLLLVEICNNNLDDDGDGLVDCDDPDCSSSAEYSTDVPKAISATVSSFVASTISIPATGTITDVNVANLNISHTYIQDVIVTLTSPSGTAIALLNQPCAGQDNIFMDLDDEASSGSFPCPPTNGQAYQPVDLLSIFDGEEANGVWTLRVYDVYGPLDGGSLDGWGLEISLHCAVEICNNGLDDDGDGLVDCDDPDCSLSLDASVQRTSCATATDGTVDLTVTGGNGTYAYEWDNDGVGDNDDTEDLAGLGLGTYNVTVTDGNSCSGTFSVNISSKNEFPYSALILTGADNTPFPTATTAGGYYVEFPAGADSFDFSFDHSFVPDGFALDSNWLGTGTLGYTMNDVNPSSNAYHFVGDRVTGFSDLDPGETANQSGRIYDVYGRGHFTYNSGSDPAGHSWTVVYDFSTLVNGYLPAGTLLGFVDIDGVASNGESVLLSATVPLGNNGDWLTSPPYDLGYNPPELPHGQPVYNSSNKTYFFNGPATTNTSIAYLTAKNLTSITMELTHGLSGGSYGLKLAAPIYPEPFTVNTTSSVCTNDDGTITIVAEGTNLEYSVDDGATFQSGNVFTGLAPGNYNLAVRDIASACERTFGGNPVVVGQIPCGEICDNGLDDDGDGLTDCDDPDCNWITISNIAVSECIDHPLADVATVEMDVSWINAPAGDMIEVSIFGKKEYIAVEFLAPPVSVVFNVPADGSSANQITASWRVNGNYCAATASYDAPAACSNDQLPCNILYISGNYSPADGNAWDNGWLQYLDQLNGAGNLGNVLAKPDAVGLGLYDPSNPTTTVAVDFGEYDLIIISATTQQQMTTGLINVLKDLPQVLFNSNPLILNDLGMTAAEGVLNVQDFAFVNNSAQRRIYNFSNINPTNANLVARGDYLTSADVVLWSDAGGQDAATGGVHFGYDITDVLLGVSPAHGKRVFLGYQMDGVYANAENAGALPVPNENWFDPIKHLTLDGKYYLDLALKQATSNCSGAENCYNNIDDDGDGLTDCKDPDCTPIPIPAVTATYRTAKSGNWANANTWSGGMVPPVGSINGLTISVEHDVVLNIGDIILDNGSKLWVTNASLTLKAGLLDIKSSTAIFTNASLITWTGNDVVLSGTKPKLYMTNSSADIGGDFENSNGNRVLENVCLTVQQQYINSEEDTLVNVCATIGNSPGGGFRNTVFSQIHIEDSEVNIVNGDFDNDFLSYVSGTNMKVWVQSGNLNNNGFWSADVTQYCVFGTNTVPASKLPPTEECATISWYFDNCDCGCLPPAEICFGGIDEDGDGLFDCEDDDCSGVVDAGPDVESCSGENVDLTASILVGNGPYTYTWSHGLGSMPNVTVNPTATTVYSVTISNASGCSSMDSVTVSMGVCSEICTNGIDDDGDGLIDCDDPDCRLTIIGSPQSPICQGGNDGSIDATTSGGKIPYTYNWSTGATSEDVNTLTAGIYQVTATDTYGCSATASFAVNDGYTLDLTAEITHSNCYGDATGSINLTVAGGTQPYTFAWSNGATSEDISGLVSGIYGVTVYDANACSKTGFYTVLHALSSAYLTYFIPLPEENIHSSFKKFTDAKNSNISSNIRTIISMVATEDGTLLYYDHWEDGYETDIFNPTQSTTEIWGDNVNSNGVPPGFSSDQLNTGDVIGVDNSVNMPRNPSQIRYDGRDKIVASSQLALSRAAWAPTPGPVLSGAVDIMDINAYGKEFEVPIGEDISSSNMFAYTSALVMAQANNTVVNIDTDGNGSTDITKVLSEGETYQLDGGVQSGLKITTSIPVQVHLITGDYNGYYENRWFTLFPCEKWDNSYFAPVGTTVSSDPAHVFVYNPNNASINVNYATKSGTGSFNVASKGVYRFEMPMHSGAHFYTNSETDVFFAMSTIDSDSGDHDAHDWGYNLLPESYLTVSATIGWGPGNADFSGNGSPAWVIASQPTILYVDYDGDPTTGPKIDPAGNQYDADFNLSSFESQRVFDNNDNDQTGMYLYTLDGTLISVAWGQDPLTAAPGNPFLDFGTTVPPIRKINGWKEYELTTDFNGDGLVDPGDELTFYLKLQNAGNSPVQGITVFDPLPPELDYIPNTTLFNNTPIADNTSGTLFPIDELGYYISTVPVNTTYVISFRTTVAVQPPLFDLVLNQFTALVTVPCKTIISEVEVPVVPYASTVDNCSLQFTNGSGSPVANFAESSQVCLEIADSDLNESSTLVDFFEITVLNSNNGDRESLLMIETGADAGVFRGCVTSSPSAGTEVEDGTLLALGGHSVSASFTDPVYGETCTDNASFILTTDTKPLYLTDAGGGLDRIDPVAVNDTTTSVLGIGSASTANCTVSDGFNTESYSNNDGTENWVNAWQELGESNGADDSYVKVSHNALRIGGKADDDDDDVNMTGRGVWREADLSGATSATLKLDFTEDYSNGFTVDLSVSGNGGSSYTTLETFTFSTGTVSRSYDISAYIGTGTRVRLLATGSIHEETSRKMYFDNIEISYNCGAGISQTLTLSPQKDTWINARGSKQNKNYGASGELKVDREASKPERSLLQFDLSSIPPGATVSSAVLYLTKIEGNDNINVDVYMVSAEWDEGSGGSGGANGDASWNQRKPGVDWTTAGGDYGPSIATVHVDGNGVYDWEVKSAVQQWIDGADNFGFLLGSPDGGGNRDQHFASSENPTVGNRPELVIKYTLSEENGDTLVFDQIAPMCTDLEMPAGGVLQVTAYVTGKSNNGTSVTLNSIISQKSDDAEEEGPEGDNGGPGYMYKSSSDLELVSDIDAPSSGTQKIGMRFQDLDIPVGATITNAFITFRAVSADSPNTNSGTTNLTIKCEDADSPSTFGSNDYNISNRTLTSASASWSPGAWTTGVDYDTPDLSAAVQEVVNRPGWSSGNSMVFVITGTGSRSAYSYDGNSALCPRLTIEYTTGGGAAIPANPDISAVLKHGATTFATLNNPVYNSAAETMIWSSILGSNYTLPAGEKVSLEIIKNDTGYSFDIEFDSETKPSKIDLPTQTIINIEELAVYDSLYPDGVARTGAENGETLYIRTTVSDPFGPEDITSLDLVVTSPSGTVLVDTTLDDQNAVAQFGCNKVYEYAWVTGVEQGIYTIDVVAHEGYEGITDEASTTIEIQFNDFGSPCQVMFTDGINEVNEYSPADPVCVQVTDIDENKNASIAETLSATLVSASGDSEMVSLVETGINTGIFTACTSTSSTVAGADNDGTLYAPMGDVLTLSYADPDILDNDECNTTALVKSISPDIDITIELMEPVDGIALVGEAVRFDITVTNTGPTALTSFLLGNTFNASQLNFTGSSLPPSFATTGSLSWIINAVVPSGGSFTIETYFTGVAPSNPAVSTASVSGNDEFSTPVAAGPVMDDVIITNPLLSIDKYLTDPLSGIYLIGDTITFQIDIANTGSTNITTLPLADQFATSCMEFVDAVPPADGSGGGAVVWNDLGLLTTAASTSVATRFVIVENCSPIENTASVTFAIDENGDPVPPAEDMASLEVETPPVAVDDADSTGISTPVTTNVPSNDYDFNGNLDIGSVTSNSGILQPSFGSIFINTTTGQITYTPVNGFSGTDAYEYIICDSTQLCDTALVTILIVNEDCSNGIDDDGDGLIDCDDPDCSGFTSGGFIGGNESNCDAYDPDQIISLSLPAGGSGGSFEYKWQYSPNGGLSWLDIIGATGMEYDPPTIPQTTFFRRGARRFACGAWKYSNFVTKSVTTCPEICDNGIDDDGDGLTDCEDDDCAPVIITSSNLSICNGFGTTISATASGGVSPYQFIWDNGLGEGESHLVTPGTTTTYRVMVVSASGCISTDSIIVSVVLCPEICTDGIDNDGDGLIDCDDPDCQAVGQPDPVWDSYTTCPGKDFIEQVIFNDNNLQDPSFSIYDLPEKGTVSIDYQGIFVYSPYNSACGQDSFIYQVCNQVTGCCDTASVFLTIGDNLPPVLQNIPSDITIGCDEAIPAIPDLVFALDVCPGIYISYSQSSTQQAGNACDSYTITRKWEATDLCGNVAVDSQVVTVEDVLAPELFRLYTLPNGKQVIGGVAENTTEQWKYVQFPTSFGTKPLVFAQVVSENEAAAVSVRARNISKQGFEMRLQEEEGADGAHLPEDVTWMAIQQGAFPDGSFEAVFLPNVNSAQANVNFVNTFPAQPAFVASVQTFDDADPMSVRYRNLSESSVALSLQEEKSFDTEGIHGNEDVGYIACEQGDILDEDGTFVGESGSLILQHNWVTVTLSRAYNKPVVICGGMTKNGGQPALLRVKDITPNSFKVRIQEWDYLDGYHIPETVSYIVMEGNIPVFTDLLCDTEAVPLVLGENLFATDNCDQQLLFTYSDSTSFGQSGLQIFRSWTASDDCGNETSIFRTDTCTRAAVQLKINLNGSIIGNFGNDLMRDDLRQKGYIPLVEPYSNDSGFMHYGDGGGETTSQAMLDVTGDDAIVDWVFVEIRDKQDARKIVATRSALLQRDGDVITAGGDSVLFFPLLVDNNYYVSVKHRNHLGVMTGQFQYLVTDAPPEIDFRQGSFFIYGQNNALNTMGNGSRAMWLGDISGDGQVIYQGPDNDIFSLFSLVLSDSDNVEHLANYISHGYLNEDVNMDGVAIYQGPNNDRAILLYHTLLPHPGNTSNLGNFIVQALLP